MPRPWSINRGAGEVCPAWPGQPMTAHWGVEDPAAIAGTEADQWVAFRQAFKILDTRIKLFTSLSIAALDRIRLQHRIDEIGKAQAESDDSPSRDA